MPLSLWLWLHEAASLVADRIAAEQAEKFVDARAALSNAREQLLDQAHRGVLDIQGRFSQISEEPETLPRGDWTTVDASYWSPEYRVEPQSSHWICILKMNWEANCFTYELVDRDDEGYGDLRVRGEDINQLWPPVDRKRTGPVPSAAVLPTNAGGRPQKWRDDLFIEIIRLVNEDPDGLPEDKAELFQHLRGLSLPHWKPDESPSDNTIRGLVNEVYKKLCQ
jgi:hypothetical protein